MTDFEYDCMQRKKLAGQARYRKRGSKSKKCTLPSDRLTQKQLKERCGPIVSFNFNRPMTWDNFKKLPAIVQAEYITNLQKKYGVTAVDLGDMFGVRALTVRKHADHNNLNVSFPRGHAMSATHRAEWNEFISVTRDASDHTSKNLIEVAPSEETAEESIGAEVTMGPTEPDTEITPLEAKSMNMKKVYLQFSGEIDIDMIANSLRLILGGRPTGELEIICNLQ